MKMKVNMKMKVKMSKNENENENEKIDLKIVGIYELKNRNRVNSKIFIFYKIPKFDDKTVSSREKKQLKRLFSGYFRYHVLVTHNVVKYSNGH